VKAPVNITPESRVPKVKRLESFLFARRHLVLGLFLLITVVLGVFASQLRMDAGFEKQMPIGHPYIETFHKYQSNLLSPNRLNIAVKAKHGTIWTVAGLRRLYEVTQAARELPNVESLGVQSLWTPNTLVNQITEEGFTADPVIPATVTEDRLEQDQVESARRAAMQGGYIGTLVARDGSSAMVVAELIELDANGQKLDYGAYNKVLETLRQRFEDKDFEIEIIGFAKQEGDIIKGASGVLVFCALSVLLAAAAVYWYCRSWQFTGLTILCSMTSLIWQFGTLKLMGLGLDPLAVLVPFLVFAIGVSHGVQQVNFIVREIGSGHSVEEACRKSFTGLLLPGALALTTAFISFATLYFVPVPMIRETSITASLGVGFKIFTNLIMLPIAATYVRIGPKYAQECKKRREYRAGYLVLLAKVAQPRTAAIVLVISAVIFGVSVYQSRDRVIGTLLPGAPELKIDSRFNKDAETIAGAYDTALDWLSVIFEAPAGSCNDPKAALYQERYIAQMTPVDGVLWISSFSQQMRLYNQGYNEGQPKMAAVPIDPNNYAGLALEVGRQRGIMKKDCSMIAAHLFLRDHKAETISRVIDETKKFMASEKESGVQIRLAAGNAGVLAAVNEVVEQNELPMMLYVYVAILILVGLVYRDWRGMVTCCLPLTVSTFIGYWFMKEEQIGLTVATLPVMVLAVGIGVDYAFYIYNRLTLHLSQGDSIQNALARAMEFEAMATVFTALTLAACVVTWAFSDLRFQSEMGKLLAFMFVVNLVMAMTTLPALAVWLERLFPRRKAVRMPSFVH